jgi:hypothetical protein
MIIKSVYLYTPYLIRLLVAKYKQGAAHSRLRNPVMGRWTIQVVNWKLLHFRTGTDFRRLRKQKQWPISNLSSIIILLSFAHQVSTIHTNTLIK